MATLQNVNYYVNGEDTTQEVLNRPLTNLDNNQKNINTQLEHTTSRTTAVEDRVGVVEDRVGVVEDRVDSEIGDRFDAVEADILTNKDDITTLSTPNNALTKAALNATGAAPIYACRAWVNFNGVDAVAIRASGNVSSITDNGIGDYTVNFATAMPDANYSVTISTGDISFLNTAPFTSRSYETTHITVGNRRTDTTDNTDVVYFGVAIFR